MKRLYALVLALCCLTGPVLAYNVQAPNSFEEAGRTSWEYQAVYRMCQEGKSPKYDLSYFESGSDLSRYELAAVIADLLDHGRNLNEADEKDLARMKKTYSRELAAHGWEPPKDERTPIIEISGDLRLRHTKGEGSDGRARLGFTYHADDATSIHAGGKAEMDK